LQLGSLLETNPKMRVDWAIDQSNDDLLTAVGDGH
jgi:hypothetical protein